MPNLAISLHATTEDQRDALVPVNRKYGLRDLIEACKRFPVKQRDRITFEYVLLDGVNDTPADARRLVRLLDGIRAKVNLLPLNEAAGIDFARPSDERVDAFARILADKGVIVSVRKSRGRDIRAACGQLLVEGTRPSPPSAWPADLGERAPPGQTRINPGGRQGNGRCRGRSRSRAPRCCGDGGGARAA